MSAATPPLECDVVVVGAGIVGLATARELTTRQPDLRVAVIEAAPAIATGQTGNNSGVIHAGIYYAPGSLKAQLCRAGADDMYAFCERHGIAHERCGKLIVARDASELAKLDELERRGRENGVPDLRRVDAAGLREIEPHARGVAALYSPHTGIVDFADVARALARELTERGVPIVTGCPVVAFDSPVLSTERTPDVASERPTASTGDAPPRPATALPTHRFAAAREREGRAAARDGQIVVRHARGETRARFVVCCAGGGSDRLAVAAGASPDPRIVPFRGAYLHLKPERRDLVRGLIYPVPDPTLPFLGVHLSRHIDGEVSLGPTALLAPGRHLPRTLAWPGTWRMARRWWRTGVTELHHALSRRSLARAAAEYVPEIEPDDFTSGFAGVRAQALGRDGKLVDDFVISDTERALHVRNAPSPAATSSLALARLIADRVEERRR